MSSDNIQLINTQAYKTIVELKNEVEKYEVSVFANSFIKENMMILLLVNKHDNIYEFEHLPGPFIKYRISNRITGDYLDIMPPGPKFDECYDSESPEFSESPESPESIKNTIQHSYFDKGMKLTHTKINNITASYAYFNNFLCYMSYGEVDRTNRFINRFINSDKIMDTYLSIPRNYATHSIYYNKNNLFKFGEKSKIYYLNTTYCFIYKFKKNNVYLKFFNTTDKTKSIKHIYINGLLGNNYGKCYGINPLILLSNDYKEIHPAQKNTPITHVTFYKEDKINNLSITSIKTIMQDEYEKKYGSYFPKSKEFMEKYISNFINKNKTLYKNIVDKKESNTEISLKEFEDLSSCSVFSNLLEY